MGKTKQNLWTKVGGKEFFARMAENAKNDGEGNEIAQTYATKDVATTSADGLLSKTDKAKLDGIAAGADENTIESISANGTPLAPDSSKNVNIPLATGAVDGLLPKEKFPLIPAEPQSGADRVYSFDDANGTSWQTIVKDYVGDVVLDQSGLPVTGEDGSPVFSEDAVGLWLSYKGTEFGARRAYEDQDGNNIKATYATKEELSDVADGLDTALDTLNDTMETVAHAGMYDLGTKTESDLTSGKLAISCGNSTTELTLTSVNAVTVLANPGVANFALLVDNTGNSTDVTVTVKDSTDTTTFYRSTAAGNTVGAGKICQVTCVGKCWSLAEFGTANA